MPHPLDADKVGLAVVEDDQQRYLVIEAIPDLRALQFGFAVGDRVLRLNGTPMSSIPEFVREKSRAMAMYRADACPLIFDIWRRPSAQPTTFVPSPSAWHASLQAPLATSQPTLRPASPARPPGRGLEHAMYGAQEAWLQGVVQGAAREPSPVHGRRAGRYGPDGMLLEERSLSPPRTLSLAAPLAAAAHASGAQARAWMTSPAVPLTSLPHAPSPGRALPGAASPPATWPAPGAAAGTGALDQHKPGHQAPAAAPATHAAAKSQSPPPAARRFNGSRRRMAC
mmetsp:Transcript_84685/g.263451  ORF Transcript_84685/g.263451 Transcript_84685/m.263451 type:complete len:283 (-) Transcript_84685:33-881(-)